MKKFTFLLLASLIVSLNSGAQNAPKSKKFSSRMNATELTPYDVSANRETGEINRTVRKTFQNKPKAITLNKSTKADDGPIWMWDCESSTSVIGCSLSDFYLWDFDHGADIYTSGSSESWLWVYECKQHPDPSMASVYFNGGYGNGVLMSIGWFVSGDETPAADDWLLTPFCEVPSTVRYKLQWDAKSVIYPTYLAYQDPPRTLQDWLNAGYTNYYSVQIVDLDDINAFLESITDETTDAEISAGFKNLGEILYATDAEYGGPEYRMITRSVEIPSTYAGKAVGFLFHGAANWTGVQIDNLQLTESLPYTSKVSVTDLPEVYFYEEPSFLNPHSTYTSKPEVSVYSLGYSPISNVMATLTLYDSQEANELQTENLNFGSIASMESKSMNATKDYTIEAGKYPGWFFGVDVFPAESAGSSQTLSSDIRIALTDNSFSQNNGIVQGPHYFSNSDPANKVFAGVEYIFPVDVHLDSILFMLDATDCETVKAYVFDVESNKIAESEAVPVQSVDGGQVYFAKILDGGVDLIKDEPYILAVEQPGNKKLYLCYANNQTGSTRVAWDVAELPAADDWSQSTSAYIINAIVAPQASAIAKQTAVAPVVANISGGIAIKGVTSSTPIAIYDILGTKVLGATVKTDVSYKLPYGTYIVTIGEKSYKALVK